MREKIIELLKKSRVHVSGDQISHSLGFSRQAVWKHIQELKDEGYEIEAVPHLGYRLLSLPDRLYGSEVKSGLRTHTFGREIHYYEALASTMAVATQLALEGSPEGAIVLAETQTKGKGRLGRTWFSPRYKGIYCSFILRPRSAPSQASLLTLLVAVAIVEAVKEYTGVSAKIKWPNDIYLGSKKLGGILTELNAETDRINFVVVGFGLNINNEKKSLISGAVSLKSYLEKPDPVSRVGLLQEIMRRLEDNYLLFQKGQARRVLEKGRHYSATLGTRVKVYCQTKHIEGEAVDIDSDGALLVRRDTGIIEKVTAGDVMHCR